jgi:cytochrome c oxidase subunit 2
MIARLDRMQTRGVLRRAVPASVTALAVVLASCGSGDDSSSGDDGDPVRRGRELAEDRGCVSCHREGGGGIGPDWEGLAGSTVTLDDGSTVVADEEYLTLAITDPDAQIVEDYDIRMPSNRLDDDEVAAIVAYIESLGDTAGSTS